METEIETVDSLRFMTAFMAFLLVVIAPLFIFVVVGPLSAISVFLFFLLFMGICFGFAFGSGGDGR